MSRFERPLLRVLVLVGAVLGCGSAIADVPAVPTIAWMPDSVPLTGGQADLDVTWDLWWGNNGDHWKLRHNGAVVHTAALTPNGQNAQHGTRRVSVTQSGPQSFIVDLCTGTGAGEQCSASAPRTVAVGSGGGGGTDGLVWPPPLLENNQPYVNNNSKVVGAYFVEWGVYGRAFPVREIPSTNLTHLLYAFIAICGPNQSLQQANPQGYSALVQECSDQPDYTVTIHDRNAALDMSYPGDAWNTPVRGNFGQLARLKAAQPQLKILPSVGGWTLSDPFHHLANDPARRATFISSLVQFLQAYTFFDGIDLDWEYPGGGGANASLGSPADKQGYSALLTELRTALNTLGTQTGRTYLLTAAVGAAPSKIAAVDYAVAAQKLDLVFAMSYDYYGGWNGVLGHHAGLYPVPNEPESGFSTNATVDGLLAAGVPASKLAIGVAMYGRGWQGVTGVQGGNPFSGTGAGAINPGTWEPGVLDYRQIESQYLGGDNGTGTNGYTAGYDAAAQAPWAWNAATGKLVTYESPRSAKAKAQYVLARGLAGVFSWEIDADNGRILNAMHEGLGHGNGGSDVIFAERLPGDTVMRRRIRSVLNLLAVLLLAGSGAVHAVQVTLVRTSAWSGGYNGQIRIHNDGQTAINGWQLGFHANTSLTSVWNAITVSSANNNWVLGNESWNGVIATGATVSIGFGGTGELLDGGLDTCVLNSSPCTFAYLDEVPGSGGTSSISIGGVSASALRTVLSTTADTQYPLTVVNNPAATFSVLSNNPDVVDASIVNGTSLRLRALQPGRAGLLLRSADGTSMRRIGVRVNQASGLPPQLPSYLAIGSVSEDTAADLDFWWDLGNGRRNKRMDVRYIYLNGGPFAGWDTWSNESGARARGFIRESKRLGFVPYFVFYNIPDAAEDYAIDLAHMQSASYMAAYFRNLQLALRIANEESPDDPVGFIFEPDFIGYMAQQSGQRPPALMAATHAVYDVGALVSGTDPAFPDTLTGLVGAINYLVARTSPQAIFGWQMNLWASPPGGFVTTVPGNGLMHKTDTVGIVAGRPLVYAEAAAITRYYVEAGIASHGADFVSVDKYGLDAVGQSAIGASDPSQAPWFWHSDHWFNYLEFVRAMKAETSLPVVLWQLPVGHVNSSQLINPYAANGPFPALDNSVTRYEDSAPSFFLGDTFDVSGVRKTWFSRNEGGAAGIGVNGNRVTWPSRMQSARDAGVVMALFGAGVGASTDGVGSPPTDAYWWITRVQDYYAAPVPLGSGNDRIFRHGFEVPGAAD